MDQIAVLLKDNGTLVLILLALFLFKGDIGSLLNIFKPKPVDPTPAPTPVPSPAPAPTVDDRPIIDAILKILPTLLPLVVPLLSKEIEKAKEPPK